MATPSLLFWSKGEWHSKRRGGRTAGAMPCGNGAAKEHASAENLDRVGKILIRRRSANAARFFPGPWNRPQRDQLLDLSRALFHLTIIAAADSLVQSPDSGRRCLAYTATFDQYRNVSSRNRGCRRFLHSEPLHPLYPGNCRRHSKRL